MVGYIEMHYPASVITQNDQNKHDLEACSWDGKEIQRDEFFGVILQECSPVVSKSLAMPADHSRRLLPQGQILKYQFTPIVSARSQRSKDNFQPLPHEISPA
jgi:hypothetical protein